MDSQIEGLNQFRCKFCNRLLARIGRAKLVEIKCPKCKQINLWKEEEEDNDKENR